MPSRMQPEQYAKAILDNVQIGAYPESEEIISSDLPAAALPRVSQHIDQAREDVKVIHCIHPSLPQCARSIATREI